MKSDNIIFGAAYYHEYMPYERIDLDMQMMKEAGMNTIRIAESTWSTLEPSDHVFDFTHIDCMLDASETYGLKVILGTPTYAIPPWLAKMYPDILTTTHAGKELYGKRQNMDLANPHYRFHAERVIKALLSHTQGRTSIIGYQLDNETNSYDTCSEYVQQLFLEYLKKEFSDPSLMNQAFGLSYWSNSIQTWEDFPDIRGTINGSLGAEFQRFQRTLVTDFLKWQKDIVSEFCQNDQFITHNFDCEWRGFSFGLKPCTDPFLASAPLDVFGIDIYHPSQNALTGAEISFAGSLARGIRNSNYLVMETQAQGNPSWLPYEGQLILQAYSHLACGSNSVMYWHWHSLHNSMETYWKGVLSHNFSRNATYQETILLGQQLKEHGHILKNLQKKCQVAIVVNNESLTGLDWFPISDSLNYNDIVRWIHDTLYRMNVECDVISVYADTLANYDLVILPALYSASLDYLASISSYVLQGGNVLETFKTGFSDEYLKVHTQVQPAGLSDCFGICYDQFTIPVNTRISWDGETYEAREWMELLTPSSAAVWAEYEHPHWGKYAAVTHNSYGLGTATYLGTWFEPELLTKIITKLLNTLSISVPAEQFPLICKKGINDFGQEIYYYLNYSDQEQTFLCSAKDPSVLTDLSGQKIFHSGDSMTIPPWGTIILKGTQH